MADRIKERKSFLSIDRRAVERKRSHLRDLEKRLSDVGADRRWMSSPPQATWPGARSDVPAPESWNTPSGSGNGHEPMRNTPRKRRFEHALRGFWPRFPVSPEPYAEEIGSHFKTRGFYPERASFGLSRTLDRYVAQAEKLPEVGQVRPRPRPSSGRG